MVGDITYSIRSGNNNVDNLEIVILPDIKRKRKRKKKKKKKKKKMERKNKKKKKKKNNEEFGLKSL